MPYGIQEPKNLAETISQMSYGGLLDVARQLVSMNEEGQRDVKTDHGMADTLADWAEFVIEEAAIEAEAAKAKPKAA
jgi:hypothetical protein